MSGRLSSYAPRQSTAGRSSSSRDSHKLSDTRMSVGRQSGRRSSQYTGRASVIVPPTTIKDSRPIRDKKWQNAAIKNLINFLMESGYPQNIVEKDIKPPSAKVFQYIFKFLYAQLDPEYEFTNKFEEDVPVILRGLRYPFSDQILKSSLMSVNSHHAWPILLAMLTWMVELIRCCDQVATDFDLDTETSGEPQAEKIFFDYLRKAYNHFMTKPEDEPDDDSMDAELIGNFDRKNEIILRDIVELTRVNELLTTELTQLQSSEDPITVLQREQTTLKSDRERFRQWMIVVEGKTSKLRDIIQGLQLDLEQAESEISRLNLERDECQAIVDSQEISPADVDRMTSEQEQLKKGLEQASLKMSDANQSLWDKELTLQKKLEQLDKAVQDYNSHMYKIGLINNENVPKSMSSDLELNVNAPNADAMVSVNLRDVARPTLSAFRQQLNTEVHRTQDEIIALQEKIENLNWTKQQKLEEIEECNSKIRKLSEQYHEQQRQIGVANSASNEEIEQYEREIQRIRLESSNAIIQSQQHLQKVSSEHSVLESKAGEARTSMVNHFAKMMIEVYQLKETVRTQIEGISKIAEKDFAEASGVGESTETKV